MLNTTQTPTFLVLNLEKPPLTLTVTQFNTIATVRIQCSHSKKTRNESLTKKKLQFKDTKKKETA